MLWLSTDAVLPILGSPRAVSSNKDIIEASAYGDESLAHGKVGEAKDEMLPGDGVEFEEEV